MSARANKIDAPERKRRVAEAPSMAERVQGDGASDYLNLLEEFIRATAVVALNAELTIYDREKGQEYSAGLRLIDLRDSARRARDELERRRADLIAKGN